MCIKKQLVICTRKVVVSSLKSNANKTSVVASEVKHASAQLSNIGSGLGISTQSGNDILVKLENLANQMNSYYGQIQNMGDTLQRIALRYELAEQNIIGMASAFDFGGDSEIGEAISDELKDYVEKNGYGNLDLKKLLKYLLYLIPGLGTQFLMQDLMDYLKVADYHHVGTQCYSPSDDAIYFYVEKWETKVDANGNYTADTYNTFFHESGHAIDNHDI